ERRKYLRPQVPAAPTVAVGFGLTKRIASRQATGDLKRDRRARLIPSVEGVIAEAAEDHVLVALEGAAETLEGVADGVGVLRADADLAGRAIIEVMPDARGDLADVLGLTDAAADRAVWRS